MKRFLALLAVATIGLCAAGTAHAQTFEIYRVFECTAPNMCVNLGITTVDGGPLTRAQCLGMVRKLRANVREPWPKFKCGSLTLPAWRPEG